MECIKLNPLWSSLPTSQRASSRQRRGRTFHDPSTPASKWSTLVEEEDSDEVAGAGPGEWSTRMDWQGAGSNAWRQRYLKAMKPGGLPAEVEAARKAEEAGSTPMLGVCSVLGLTPPPLIREDSKGGKGGKLPKPGTFTCSAIPYRPCCC